MTGPNPISLAPINAQCSSSRTPTTSPDRRIGSITFISATNPHTGKRLSAAAMTLSSNAVMPRARLAL